MDALSISLQTLYSDAFSNLIQLVALIMGFIGVLAGFNLYYQNKNNDKALERKIHELRDFYQNEVSLLTTKNNETIQAIKDEQAARETQIKKSLDILEFEVENSQALGFYLQAKTLPYNDAALKSSANGLKICLNSSLPAPNNRSKETRKKNVRVMLKQVYMILNASLVKTRSKGMNPIFIHNTLDEVLKMIKEQTEHKEQYEEIAEVIKKIEAQY